MLIHTVKSGEDITKIAEIYGVTPASITDANGLTSPDRLAVGTALIIPSDLSGQRVQNGDSLYSIAMMNGISLDELIRLNPNIKPPYTVYAGQTVLVPKKAKSDRITVGGYCYPSIKEEVLTQVLPYLTYLLIFSYRLSANGELQGINDQRLISLARDGGVSPIMVITNIGASGGFDSDALGQFLSDPIATGRFIDTISDTLRRKGYGGLNLDLEYIPAQNKEDYNRFMQSLGDRLRSQGLYFSVCAAPKISQNQRGILYEGHDYKSEGKFADEVYLMTYEWGYMYGPPLAVAPLPQVESVVRYAASEIESRKLLLGQPNYGYDWTLPYKRGTSARAVTLNTAVNLAISQGSRIEYNSTSQAPFFTYRDQSGNEHIVWFDDARSFNARYNLIDEYRLGGVFFWTVNSFFKPMYYILADRFLIKKV